MNTKDLLNDSRDNRGALVAVILAATMLAACTENEPGPNLHDSKYAFVDANGQETVAVADASCVIDRYTGLLWELKTDADGLRNWRNTYSWYDPDEKNDPEGLDYRGTAGAGECAESACDTSSFVNETNKRGLCGYQDWRLPQRDEIGTISDVRRLQSPPTANTAFFPRMKVTEYWSANDYSFQWDAAWAWNFEYGHDRVDWKASPKHVRLVRGDVFDPKQAKG